MSEFCQYVVDCLFEYLAPLCLAEHDQCMQIDTAQQGLVVEHLLEVRHEPLAVDGVPGKAATDVVVHAAGGHCVERSTDDLFRGVT